MEREALASSVVASRAASLRLACSALLLAMTLGACSPVGAPREAKTPAVSARHGVPSAALAEQLAGLEEAVGRAVETHGLPALAMGVVTREGLVWSRGWGHQGLDASSARLNERSVFPLGSLTKLVTSLAALRLQDLGRVSFDAPASGVVLELDRLVYPSTDRRAITLRQLLTHRAGLPRNGPLSLRSSMRQEQLIASLVGLRLESSPGRLEGYSNLGYALAGVVIERSAGERYRDWVSEQVLGPLAMRDSAWSMEEVPASARVAGRARAGAEWREAAPSLDAPAVEATAGLWGSLDDVSCLARAALDAWEPGEDEGAFSKATLRAWQTPDAPPEPGAFTYAMGWVVMDDPTLGRIIGHSSESDVFSAAVVLAPEHDLGVVALLATGDGATLDQLASRTLRRLVQRRGWASPLLSDATMDLVPDEVVQEILSALFEKSPDEKMMRSLFSAAFLAERSAMALTEDFANIERALGVCKVEQARSLGAAANEREALVRCERGALTVRLRTGKSRPYLIESLVIAPAQ